jgi:hypothetical protein
MHSVNSGWYIRNAICSHFCTDVVRCVRRGRGGWAQPHACCVAGEAGNAISGPNMKLDHHRASLLSIDAFHLASFRSCPVPNACPENPRHDANDGFRCCRSAPSPAFFSCAHHLHVFSYKVLLSCPVPMSCNPVPSPQFIV